MVCCYFSAASLNLFPPLSTVTGVGNWVTVVSNLVGNLQREVIGLHQPVWPDVAKFRHFGYFLRALATFFSGKVAKEFGDFFGYFLNWPKFLIFNAINSFSKAKIDPFLSISEIFIRILAIFKTSLLVILVIWANTLAPN